jgi:hypothetical protein
MNTPDGEKTRSHSSTNETSVQCSNEARDNYEALKQGIDSFNGRVHDLHQRVKSVIDSSKIITTFD